MPFPFPYRQPGKALHQFPHDLLIRIAVKQCEREHEIDHGPGRQQPFPLLPAPRLREHVLDQLPRDEPGQHAQRDPVRQRRPSRDRRPGTLLGHGQDNTRNDPGKGNYARNPHTARRVACGNVESAPRVP